MSFPLFTPKYNINGRIYRRNPSNKQSRKEFAVEAGGGDTIDLYGTDEEEPDDLASSHCEQPPAMDEGTKTDEMDDFARYIASELPSFPNLFNEKSKKWSSKIMVPSELIRFVIGAKGAVKRKLEEETNCRIVVPSRTKEEPLEIFSKSEEGVKRCKDRIELIVMDARNKAPFTHFVSFSAAASNIKDSFIEFAEKIKSDEELPETCRDEDLFQEPKKLHFTVVMLSLLDSRYRKAASKVLEILVQTRIRKILDGKPLDIEVRGLEYMNDDPTKVNVLYAHGKSDLLQKVADEIARGMEESGLCRHQEGGVKIHLTLMNTRYAWENGKKIYMDVRKLMEKYGDFNFGKLTVTEVHISSLNEEKNDDGYYTSIGSFRL